MFDLTGFQRDVLFVMAGLGEANGLEILEKMEGELGEDLHHGRVYPNLDTLAEKGLVRKGHLDDRTNVYALTDRGVRELRARRDWAAEAAGLG